jgi:hypothetical protein
MHPVHSRCDKLRVPHANVCKAVREGYKVLTIRGLARKYGLSEKTVRYILRNPGPEAPPAVEKPPVTKSVSQIQREIDHLEAKAVKTPGPSVEQFLYETQHTRKQPVAYPVEPIWEEPPMGRSVDKYGRATEKAQPTLVTINPRMPQPQVQFRTTYIRTTGPEIGRSAMPDTARGSHFDLFDPQGDF